jgi:hypothetical protein
MGIIRKKHPKVFLKARTIAAVLNQMHMIAHKNNKIVPIILKKTIRLMYF